LRYIPYYNEVKTNVNGRFTTVRKYLSLLLSAVMAMSAFTSYGYGCEETAAYKADRKYVQTETDGLSIYSLASVGDIRVRAVYEDTEGKIKAVAFKADGDIPDNLCININGTDYPVTSTAEDGVVYQYFDDIVTTGEAVAVQFFTDDESGEVINTAPIKIVTTDENDWLASDNGHTLYLYKGSNKDVVVPNFYNGKVVESIGGYYDTSAGELVSVLRDSSDKVISSCAISEGITTINPYAFYNVRGFTTLSLPTTLKTIDEGAFWNCRELSGDLTIPGGVKTVGAGAFIDCTSLNGSLVLEEGVEKIDDLAFAGMNANQSFTSLSLPSTLKSIGCYAFQNCVKISSELILPEGLEVISDGAFDHLSALSNTTLVIPSTVRVIGGDYGVYENTGYGGHVFYDMGKNDSFTAFEVAEGNEYFKAVDGVLYSADMTRMLAYPRGKRDTVYEIPEGITQLDEMAFSRAAYLKTVILPDSYEITTDIPENILNQDGNSLSIALYVYNSVSAVTVKPSNTRYKSIDGMLYSLDGKSLWYIPTKYSGDVNISDSCEVMEKGSIYVANKANTNWKTVNIPSSVTEIDSSTAEFLNKCFKGYMYVGASIYYSLNSSGELEEIAWSAGDVDMNGTVDKTDAQLVLKYVSGLGLTNSGTFNKKAADADTNGEINLLDSIIILKKTEQSEI
jgi:hypothetical protein